MNSETVTLGENDAAMIFRDGTLDLVFSENYGENDLLLAFTSWMLTDASNISNVKQLMNRFVEETLKKQDTVKEVKNAVKAFSEKTCDCDKTGGKGCCSGAKRKRKNGVRSSKD